MYLVPFGKDSGFGFDTKCMIRGGRIRDININKTMLMICPLVESAVNSQRCHKFQTAMKSKIHIEEAYVLDTKMS